MSTTVSQCDQIWPSVGVPDPSQASRHAATRTSRGDEPDAFGMAVRADAVQHIEVLIDQDHHLEATDALVRGRKRTRKEVHRRVLVQLTQRLEAGGGARLAHSCVTQVKLRSKVDNLRGRVVVQSHASHAREDDVLGHLSTQARQTHD